MFGSKMEGLLVAIVLTYMSGFTMSMSVPISSIYAATLRNSHSVAPHPCSYSISGTWANATVLHVTPYPLKADQPTHVYLNFTAGWPFLVKSVIFGTKVLRTLLCLTSQGAASSTSGSFLFTSSSKCDFDDLWFGNIRGNVTRLEDKWEYSLDFSVCGSKGICPVRKGENRVYNETFPPPSTFARKGTYRGWLIVVNQDDEVIYSITLNDCPIK